MLTQINTTKWLITFAEKINVQQDYLNELDNAIGDGDHGSNMVRGTEAMKESLNEGDYSSVEKVFKAASMSLLSKIGGASGPLYGTAFISMSKQASQDNHDVIAILKAGLEGIKRRGKAQTGEKTMLDFWEPAIEILEQKNLTHEKIRVILEQTKDIKATKGRASYLGDHSIGHIDPGSASSSCLFEALLEGDIINE